MKSPFKKILFVFAVIGALVVLPSVSVAQQNPGPSSATDASCLWTGGCWKPLVTCTGDYAGLVEGSSGRPKCTSICDVIVTGQNFLLFALTIIFYILFPAYILLGGIFYASSQGSPENISRAHDLLTRTFIGLLFALGSFLIIGTMLYIIGNPTSGYRVNWPEITCDRDVMYQLPTTVAQ